MATYKEYKSRVVKTDDFQKVIAESRAEQNISATGNALEYVYDYIPFNLEREYFDALVDELKFDEARRILDIMKISYTTPDHHNFIEQYEYRLNLVMKMEKMIEEKVKKVEKDFNHHTIFITSIIVGVITIFGTANNAFRIDNFSSAKWTFGVISLTLVCFIALVFWINRFTK